MLFTYAFFRVQWALNHCACVTKETSGLICLTCIQYCMHMHAVLYIAERILISKISYVGHDPSAHILLIDTMNQFYSKVRTH